MGIKAIETEYAGCRFRSRLEARWAVLFDAMQVKWEYEPQGFEFEDGTHYLPDFYLPESGDWVEIKGGKPTKAETHKIVNLASALAAERTIVRVLAGDIPRPEQVRGVFLRAEAAMAIYPEPSTEVLTRIAAHQSGDQSINDLTYEQYEEDMWTWSERAPLEYWKICPCPWAPRASLGNRALKSALIKARSARFEHGECG